MSYDLFAFEPSAAPKETDAFLDWFESQTQWSEDHDYHDPAVTTPKLAAWYAELRKAYPNMMGPDAYDVDNAPETTKITEYSIGRNGIYASFRWPEAAAARNLLRALAVKHGVGFFNASNPRTELWRPRDDRTRETADLADLTLTLEGQPPFDAPSLALIEAAVDWLDPAGGTGFLVLEHRNGDYAQVGGGGDGATLEWRSYTGSDFRHDVAGTPTGDRHREVRIEGNGAHFTVRANERLSSESVQAILVEFARGAPRPAAFVWRDISGRLA